MNVLYYVNLTGRKSEQPEYSAVSSNTVHLKLADCAVPVSIENLGLKWVCVISNMANLNSTFKKSSEQNAKLQRTFEWKEFESDELSHILISVIV